MWTAWVRFWSTREAPLSLAIVRIAAGLALTVDFVGILSAGVIDPLYLPVEAGGLSAQGSGFWVATLGGPSAALTHGLAIAATVLGGMLCVGLGGRLTCLLLLQVLITFHRLTFDVGGAYDRLFINLVFLLMLSRSTATLSLDCRLRSGRWLSAEPVPAFPRYLMVFQVIVLYFMAGYLKTTGWSYPYEAVYRSLLRPTCVRWETGLVGYLYPLTQLGTVVTWWWEVSFFIMGLWFLARRGVLGARWTARAVRRDLRIPYLGIGLIMHGSLLLMLNIGSFVVFTLCFYLAFVEPEEWSSLARWLRSKVTRATR